jgi:uncharacterized repeat protein (TIGR01451 family)
VKGLASRTGAPLALAASGLLLITLAAALGAKVPTTRALPAPPAVHLNVAKDAAGVTFPDVTARFLTEALGPDVSPFLTPRPAAVGSPKRTAPTRPGPSARPPGPNPNPSPGPSPGPTGLPPPFQFSQLTITMRADRTTAQPGDTITYQAIVTNVGTHDFRGAYQLSSHVPFGTVDTTTPCNGTFGIDPGHDCVNPPVPAPGSPDPNVHQISYGFTGTLGRGKQHVTVIKVRVNETTQPGTRLENHAHLDVVGDGKPAITSGTVTVVISRFIWPAGRTI